VQLRKKILSYFILTIYLLIVAHKGVSHSHESEVDTSNHASHQHEEFEDVHHEHSFHVGIFHLLGHLYENINHSNDHSDNHSDDHLVVLQKSSTKKVVDYNKTNNFFLFGNNTMVFDIDSESLPDPPPFHLFLLQRLKQPSTPLRGPPSFV